MIRKIIVTLLVTMIGTTACTRTSNESVEEIIQDSEGRTMELVWV